MLINQDELREKLPIFEGKHFWVVNVVFRANPENMENEKEPFYADHENIVNFNGPGCYFCYQFYTPEIAAQKCRADEIL